jgi:hypothetical protein
MVVKMAVLKVDLMVVMMVDSTVVLLDWLVEK